MCTSTCLSPKVKSSLPVLINPARHPRRYEIDKKKSSLFNINGIAPASLSEETWETERLSATD